MNEDLTILYYTANKEPEGFMKRLQDHLRTVIGNAEIVSVSQKPIQFGRNTCIGEVGMSLYNLYYQALLAVREAHTPYVAIAEDDMAYTKEHFAYRPPENTLGYDVNKWALFTWSHKVFSKRHNRRVMSMLTAPRLLLLNTLEERYKKYHTVESIPPDIYRYYWGEPGRFENNAGITPLQTEMYECKTPSIAFFTEQSLGFQYLGKRKKLGDTQTESLEPWGTAERTYEDFYNR
jgi:hypothetical protein